METYIYLILQFLSTDQKVNKKFIENVYQYLRPFYVMEDYVKDLSFCNNNYGPYLAYCFADERILVINLEKIMKSFTTWSNEVNIEEKDIIKSVNIYILHILQHEFEHI